MVPGVCCVLGWGWGVPIFQYSSPWLCSQLLGMCFGVGFFYYYFSLACPKPLQALKMLPTIVLTFFSSSSSSSCSAVVQLHRVFSI